MQTHFPDLPFTHGNVDLTPIYLHSTVKSTPPAYPRTDLNTLTHWATFPDDIHQAIQSAAARVNVSSTPFHITGETDDTFVDCEQRIHSCAELMLHRPVLQALRKLRVKGKLTMPGCEDIPIVGSPDFLWMMGNERRCPKLIVEYETWWTASLEHVIAAFNDTHGNPFNQHTLYALERIYGYMSFNDKKYGILTNWRRALFLRRAETSDRRTLECYTVELDGPDQSISMLKAWVGMALLAKDDWYYAPPTTAPLGREVGISIGAAQDYQILPVHGGYHCLPLDFHLCRFDLKSARHGNISCMVNACLLASPFQQHDLQVICKVVDPSRYPNTEEWLDDEARAYATLEDLQGKVIPTLYGFYEIWGILHLLALEPVGSAIPEDEPIDPGFRNKMKAALRCIHEAGYVHGDIARRNFCRTESGEVFLIDLERCRRFENPSELDYELNEVDGL